MCRRAKRGCGGAHCRGCTHGFYNQRPVVAQDFTVKDQPELARRFRALHEQQQPFVIPNVWDGGSAAVMVGLGFPALATSSSAYAATLGRDDYQIRRDEALRHARLLCELSPVPVAADLENGFGAAPQVVAETIRQAGEVGLVGGSIEDASGEERAPLYDFNHAVERVAAAVEAARGLPFPFTLTARAEGYFYGTPDPEDIVRRLQAFERAGADVLFAPGLPDLAAVRTVCSALRKPVNFMVGIRGKSFSVAELAAAGVRRISLSTSLYRAAMGGLYAAAREVHGSGTFNYLESALSGGQLGADLRKLRPSAPATKL
jgi:2-methylisocitrate lyase-like PEP mutase family enzyme